MEAGAAGARLHSRCARGGWKDFGHGRIVESGCSVGPRVVIDSMSISIEIEKVVVNPNIIQSVR